MSHLDEGTLHALLDGELDIAEVSEIQMHLGTCVACGSRLQEVKQVLAEADRLVQSVEMPAEASPPREAGRPAPPSKPLREPVMWDENPVLLVPDPVDANARRKKWLRGLRWVAVIAVVFVGGEMLKDTLRPGRPMLSERELTSTAPRPPAVVSPEESRAPEPAAKARGKPAPPRSTTQAAASKDLAKREPVPEERPEARAVDSATSLADTAAPSAGDTVSAEPELLAAQAAADSTTDTAAGVDTGAGEVALENARVDSIESKKADEIDVRGAAAKALAELDRQRRTERANAATAAIQSARAAPADSGAIGVAASAPRTLEQRSQIYLRIGLDEAVKQLGRPVHVIEGMTPQFIGLTRGQLVPGADPKRPVVRVVYLDARGRMILLDQQRIAPGQAPGAPSGNLRWTLGDVLLYLRGEPGPDVLRSLQARVR